MPVMVTNPGIKFGAWQLWYQSKSYDFVDSVSIFRVRYSDWVVKGRQVGYISFEMFELFDHWLIIWCLLAFFGYLELWKHAQYCNGFSSFVISTMIFATLVFCGLSCFTQVKEDHFHYFCSIETSGIIFVRVLWNHSRLTLGLIYSIFLWRKKLWLAYLFN